MQDVVVEHETEMLAVFRHIGKTGIDRLAHGADVNGLAVDQHFAADLVAIGLAEHAHRKFGAPCPHQTGDADDFALAHGDVDIMQNLAVAMLLVIGVPVLDFENGLADRHVARRITIFKIAPHHVADDNILADFFLVTVERLHRHAIAQHGDLVGHLAHFVELVGDDDRGHALLAEFHQQVQQRLGIAFVERSRRLIEDEQLHALRQRLGDFDQLLLANADIGDQRLRRFLQPHLLQKFAGTVEGLLPADDAVRGDLVTKEDVFRNRQKRHERQLLVNDDDTNIFTVVDGAKIPHCAFIVDFALIGAGGVNTGKDLHQGRLPRAVLTDECVDLTLLNLEVDVLKRFHARKRLGDVPHFENGIGHIAIQRPINSGVFIFMEKRG